MVRRYNFTWKRFRTVLTWRVLLFASLEAILALGLAIWLFQVPMLNISILDLIARLIAGGITLLVHASAVIEQDIYLRVWSIELACLILLRKRMPTVIGNFHKVFQNLPNAALREEWAFRAHAERWSWGQRIRSCLSFGLIHMTMLVVPLAAVIVIGVGGAVLMSIYLRTYQRTKSVTRSALRAATYHATYNLAILSVSLAGLVGYLLWALVVHFLGH